VATVVVDMSTRNVLHEPVYMVVFLLIASSGPVAIASFLIAALAAAEGSPVAILVMYAGWQTFALVMSEVCLLVASKAVPPKGVPVCMFAWYLIELSAIVFTSVDPFSPPFFILAFGNCIRSICANAGINKRMWWKLRELVGGPPPTVHERGAWKVRRLKMCESNGAAEVGVLVRG
jgi:hypothetical protein